MNEFSNKNFNISNNKIFIYLINLFLLFYFIFGFYFSINTGISTDEFIELENWELSRDAIKNFFGFNKDGYANLYAYEWKFHGIGHHFFSKLYILFLSFFFTLDKYPLHVSDALLSHSFYFFTFFLSGIFAKKILNLLIKNEIFSNIFLVFYLLYPYLLGHGFYNPKDVPFLCVWLLCTYLSIKIFLHLSENKNIDFINIIFLSVSTAFLFSIRVSGILILFQYLIMFLISWGISGKTLFEIIKLYLIKVFFFFFLIFLFTFLLYPVFWENPLLIYDSINQMRNIPYGVCTLTLGNCMDSLNLPSSYIFIWLFFKLPLLSLIGFCFFPLVEKKIFSQKDTQLILGSILITIISIIFLLIFFQVNLYDELRHVLFLFPLILIATFSIIYYFSKKILFFISILSIIIFLVQNINMYPYQYTWFNSFGNFININNNFELDYWGVSGRNIAKKINKNTRLLSEKERCIYVSPKHIIEPFISPNFSCVKSYFSIYPKSSEKYILVKYTRNIRRENPDNCELIFEERYNLNLFANNLTMGKVFLCN